MTLTSFIIFGVILVIITLYIIIYHIYPSSGSSDILSTMTSLSQKKDIAYSDKIFQSVLSTSGSSIMGFFKIDGNDKTMKIDNGFIPLLQIENNVVLEISPVPEFKSGSSARLRIYTNNPSNNKSQEIINLPPIPQQKWVFIAILRDGRRFDVIYDNRIVASHRLEYYPSVIPSPLSVGDKSLLGSVIHVLINSKRMSPYDVERLRLSYIDTNGKILEDNTMDISFPTINIFAVCPPGLPCDPITKPPPNNMYQWSTPYA